MYHSNSSKFLEYINACLAVRWEIRIIELFDWLWSFMFTNFAKLFAAISDDSPNEIRSTGDVFLSSILIYFIDYLEVVSLSGSKFTTSIVRR